ncbi:MAG: efflux RND transporter permease subunit [Gammaproteobacteria bacterium]|nr:efflux RND transporter permease subunit [Gammaproteobacteria bacterium]
MNDEQTKPNADEPELNHAELGIAGRITKQFINSPVTPLLMMAFLAIGLLGLMFTPRQEDPKISVPMVDIFVQYAGASGEQVTSLVTEPLERIMSEIPGVRHVYSATRRGNSMVTVQFKVGEDLGQSIVKVHDKLQSNLDSMPPGVAMPLVKPVGIDDVPVVTATLWSKDVDDGNLRTLAFDVLQRLQEVPNTGKGSVVGGRKEQIRVEAYPERMSGFGISLDQLARTIKTANAEQTAGSIEGGNTAFTVYTGAFLHTAQEISRLVVGVHNGAPIYVRDIAHVFQAPQDTTRLVTYYTGTADERGLPHANGEAAVTIAIAKKIDTNGVTVANEVLKKLDSLKGSLIPNNVEVEITRNYGQTANDKVNELLTALFEAAIAVSLLCMIGLGLRAASVVITIIPIVILITVWSAWILDYTIDRVSLFALVFAIGILVDDATVVVENIFRRWLTAGKTSLDIAVDAVREVGNPTILATLTIISALLPMGFVSGMMGPYMRPIPVLGSSAMFFSLIAAFIFAPWFAMRVRPQLSALAKAEKREQKVRDFIGRYYRPIMRPLCTNRKLGLGFLFGLIGATFLACAMFYINAVTVKMLPFDNKPEFNVVVNMPEGTALPVTANATNRFAEALRTIPEVTSLQTYSGTASPFNFNGMVRHYYLREQPWEADIQVMLLDKNDRERGSHDIAVEARHILNRVIDSEPDLKATGVKIQVVEMPPGPPVLQTVVAEIYGPTAETRRQVARDMTAMFEQAEGVVDVDNYMTDQHEYWHFEVDIEKAVRYGVSVDTINQNLSMAMGGYQLGDIKRQVVREPTYIVLQVPLTVRSQIQRLKNLPISTNQGHTVPLSELGRFNKKVEEPIIFHKDLRGVEYVTGEMEGRLGAPIYGMYKVEDMLVNYVTPDGASITGMPKGLLGPPEDDAKSGFEWGGEWTVTYETFRDMGIAFMAALVLIYGLIVWEFKNFKLAGLIMAPIPLTLIGIIPGHWVVNAEFTATSMIGFIALAGIIVRNSILLVEFVKHEVEKGKEIQEAVIAAGQTRMRPIFITSLTLMAGAGALLSDPIFQGMAVSLLFGAAVATVLTLVVIPLGCISASKQFYILLEKDIPVEEPKATVSTSSGLPLWMVVWTKVISAAMWTFYTLRAFYIMARMVVEGFLKRFQKPTPPPSAPSGGSGVTPPAGPSSGGNGGGSSTPPGGEPPVSPAGNQEVGDAEPVSASATAEKKTVKKKVARKKSVKKKASGVVTKPAEPLITAEKAEPVQEENSNTSNAELEKQADVEDKTVISSKTELETSTASSAKKGKKRRGIRLKTNLETATDEAS